MTGRRWHEVNRRQPTWREELKQALYLVVIGLCLVAGLFVVAWDGVR